MLHGNSSMWMHNLLKQEESSMHRASRIYAAFHRDDVAVLSTWIQLHSQRQETIPRYIAFKARNSHSDDFLNFIDTFYLYSWEPEFVIKISLFCLISPDAEFIQFFGRKRAFISKSVKSLLHRWFKEESIFRAHTFLEANFHLPWISDNSGRSKF